MGNFSFHSWARLHTMSLLVIPESPVLSSKSSLLFLEDQFQCLYFVPLSVTPFPPTLSRPFTYLLLYFLHTSVRAYPIVFVSFTCLLLPVNLELAHVIEHVFIHLCMPRSSIYAFGWAGGDNNRQGSCFDASNPPEI